MSDIFLNSNNILYKYLGFVRSNIVDITICPDVVPDSIHCVKVTNKFQSSSRIQIRAAENETVTLISQLMKNKPGKLTAQSYLFTDLINVSRMTDSMWDSARVRR